METYAEIQAWAVRKYDPRMEYVINVNKVISNPVTNVLKQRIKILVVIFKTLMENVPFVNQDIME